MQIDVAYLDLDSTCVVHCEAIRGYEGGRESSPAINSCNYYIALSDSQ